MKFGLNRYRLMVAAGRGLLIVLLVVMVANLLSQLDVLPRAAEDNMRWSMSQIDAEFANLDATLTEQTASQPHSDQDVKLRVDIALSRLSIITTGRAEDIIADDPDAEALTRSINDFAQRAVALMDLPGPMTGATVEAMQRTGSRGAA